MLTAFVVEKLWNRDTIGALMKFEISKFGASRRSAGHLLSFSAQVVSNEFEPKRIQIRAIVTQ
uniref:Uncharacterized protein n=1 Tax=Romanomermis culicivorax TaxID=13658 RepID=A0A915I7I1_ROMCU